MRSSWSLALFATFFLLVAPQLKAGPVRELGLEEALHLAENESPGMRAGEAKVEQARAGEKVSRSGYYPSLDLGVLDSTGFPGSTGGSLGIWGLTASPFRSGVAGGFFSKVQLFNRSRDYGAVEATKRLRSSEAQSQVTRSQVDQETLQAFIDASRSRAHLETWLFMEDESRKVSKIVNRLVRNGQHSEVSKLLVQDQVDQARIKRALYEKRYAESRVRLALLIGTAADSFDCPPASLLQETSLGFFRSTGTNPMVRQAEADILVAQAGVSRSRADFLPKVSVVGSAGMMEATRFVPKNDYAAAVGIDFPIFEGFRTVGETQRAQAKVQERESELDAVKLDLAESLSKYDEVIAVTREQLRILEPEQQDAIHALDLAKYRYRMFQGLLVDVREALNNLGRIKMQINDARADLILALGSRALLEGAEIR